MQGKGLKLGTCGVTDTGGLLSKGGVRGVCGRASSGNPGYLWPQDSPDPSFSELLSSSPIPAKSGL